VKVLFHIKTGKYRQCLAPSAVFLVLLHKTKKHAACLPRAKVEKAIHAFRKVSEIIDTYTKCLGRNRARKGLETCG
jgi:hypothetical protein